MSETVLEFGTRVEQISFGGHEFYIKRDDLISRDFSGNKARKFHYFLDHDLPQIDKIVSYGSNQSNAMYSMSVLAKLKGWEFEYYVDHIPRYLHLNPVGNYAGALANGMVIRAQKDRPREIQDHKILLIEEGGRQQEAEYGISILADEITQWQITNDVRSLDIFLPSGTGTTALYLQKSFAKRDGYLSTDVYTSAAVGGGAYLKKQFYMLESNEKYHPTILELPQKYHFGKLYREFYDIWSRLQKEVSIEFDMLYDPQGWLTLMEHRGILGTDVMYIHQGGVLGNESMLPRYIRKFGNITI